MRRRIGAKELAAAAGSVVLIALAVWMSRRVGDLGGLGYVGGFLAMLFSSATVILPAPGIAVVAVLGSSVPSPLLLGLISGLGATIGESTGYLAGYGASKFAEKNKYYPKIHQFIERHGFTAIALLAFIPNPFFDVAGIAAGGARLDAWKFFLATFIGKACKCIVFAYAGALSTG